VIKVGIFARQPVQYQIPWILLLSKTKGIHVTVYYSLLPTSEQQGIGFGVPFMWDIPLLEGYEWKVLPNNRKKPDLSNFFSTSNPTVGSVLSEDRPDVVIITGWHCLSLLQALWASRKLGIPRIVRGESNSIAKRAKWKSLFHNWLLFKYDAFLSIGKKNREFYLGYGISPERIFDAPYFVDNERFQSDYLKFYSDRFKIRKAWNIPDDAYCYLFAGKVEPKKRLMDLLKALDIARKVRADLHLLVVGTGPLMQEMQSFAVARKLPVTFAGFLNQSEITKAYLAANCLVLPSDAGETWGLVVNEAMACGLPVIVSDHVGCGLDLIEDGVTGKVFPMGDISCLSKCLIELSSSNEVSAVMGNNARNRIAKYSVEEVVKGTIAAIEFVVGKSPRGLGINS
jgi:glycosyltransferase involved in cell wall biosynthesis